MHTDGTQVHLAGPPCIPSDLIWDGRQLPTPARKLSLRMKAKHTFVACITQYNSRKEYPLCNKFRTGLVSFNGSIAKSPYLIYLVPHLVLYGKIFINQNLL